MTRDATRDVTRVRFPVRIRVRGFYQVHLYIYICFFTFLLFRVCTFLLLYFCTFYSYAVVFQSIRSRMLLALLYSWARGSNIAVVLSLLAKQLSSSTEEIHGRGGTTYIYIYIYIFIYIYIYVYVCETWPFRPFSDKGEPERRPREDGWESTCQTSNPRQGQGEVGATG